MYNGQQINVQNNIKQIKMIRGRKYVKGPNFNSTTDTTPSTSDLIIVNPCEMYMRIPKQPPKSLHFNRARRLNKSVIETTFQRPLTITHARTLPRSRAQEMLNNSLRKASFLANNGTRIEEKPKLYNSYCHSPAGPRSTATYTAKEFRRLKPISMKYLETRNITSCTHKPAMTIRKLCSDKIRRANTNHFLEAIRNLSQKPRKLTFDCEKEYRLETEPAEKSKQRKIVVDITLGTMNLTREENSEYEEWLQFNISYC
eukprot:TRINITY_DN2708_c0_g1_i1.p1 TRINITY_DN2708_c0_g1~~TRINITY_DN2708_c0_g1_i1.p1  ORF type:complete len:257 (-),score=2.53 TRINITY_DN2708_c0_g1_i1:643-1413(-)